MMWLEYYKQFRTAEAREVEANDWKNAKGVGKEACEMISIQLLWWGRKDGSDIFSDTGTSEGKNRSGEQDVEFIF